MVRAKTSVLDTQTVFWSNLEGGLSLLAVNLPSLSAIVGKLSAPASQLVASIRSAISLRSVGSGSHRSSRSRRRGVVGGGGGPAEYVDGSQVQIREAMKGQESSEWHRLGEIDSRETAADDGARDSEGAENNAERAARRVGMV